MVARMVRIHARGFERDRLFAPWTMVRTMERAMDSTLPMVGAVHFQLNSKCLITRLQVVTVDVGMLV